MSTGAQEASVLFVDVTGSVRIYANQGDQEAAGQITACLERLAGITQAAGGKVIKSLGDGMICAFRRADEAYLAATQMKSTEGGEPLAIHAGVHVGPVIFHDGDLLGQTVNIAARICDYAQAGEFMVSDQLFHDLSPSHQSSLRYLGEVQLKGLIEPVPVHEIVTGEADLTRIGDDIKTALQSQQVLEITYRGESHRLTMSTPALSLGRSPDNTIVVGAAQVSRQHCTIGPGDGGFFLNDRSNNGTALLPEGQAEQFLKRQSARITGRGQIILGSAHYISDDSLLTYSLGY